MIIGILFFSVFFALLAKAIFETIWGLCIVIHGLFWHAIAIALKALANTIRAYNKIVRIFKKPKPKGSIVNGLKRIYGV
jgi:hypothetical protein